MRIAWPLSGRLRITLVIVAALALAALLAAWWFVGPQLWPAKRLATVGDAESAVQATVVAARHPGNEASPDEIEFPRESWGAAKIVLQPVEAAPLEQTLELTGKVSLNQDRVAHIYPLVEGRVAAVNVQFGQRVAKGELLVVVRSREVGSAMLKLYEDRLLLEYAKVKDRWTQSVKENTHALIDMIQRSAPLEEIEDAFRDRALGSHRNALLTAYIELQKHQIDMQRLEPLSQQGAVAARRFIESESQMNAARATLQSLMEQIRQDTVQAAMESAQAVKELQTRVTVDEASLRIIGFDDESLAAIDSQRLGEMVSHYPVVAPFDGTIISKDVALLERVGPESQILSIADLSTVWINADIYEEHLSLLESLDQQTIYLKSAAWPDRTFQARVFYTGDVVDESTRTISLRALADNDHGHLKPGMFVRIEVPSGSPDNVVQVPLEAVQAHAGNTFVFVHVEGDRFARRDVVLGRRNDRAVEIVSGLALGEMAVVSGGFTLKSQMLAELLEE